MGYSYAPPYGWWYPAPDTSNADIWHTGYLEEDSQGKPNLRYPHNPGQLTGISFKYGPSTDATWRAAFEAAWMQWNRQPTKMYYYPDYSNGVVTFDKEYVSGYGANYGDSYYQGSGGISTSCQAYGNSYTTGGFSPNKLEWVVGHESGHTCSIGHIANLPDGRIITSVMGYNNNNYNDPYNYYPMDSEFINQFYP